MGESIVITSGKGGVGKSTLTANLGLGLARLGKKTLVLDGDIGLRTLDVLLGLENKVVYDLVDVAEGICRTRQALIHDARYENLYLMPAAQTRDSGAVTPRQMEKMLSKLQQQFDYVLIDCPAGIGRGFKNAVVGAQRAIVVTVPDIVSLRDAERVVGLLEKNDLLHPELLVNRALPEHQRPSKQSMMSLALIQETLPLELLGVVPEDAAIGRSALLGSPAVLGPSPAGRAFERIARRVVGEDVPIPPLKPASWLTRLRARIARPGGLQA